MRALLAVDLEAASELLVERAVVWARRAGATLSLRTVSSLRGDGMAVTGSPDIQFVAADWERRRTWERTRLEDLAELVPKDMRGDLTLADGTPWRVLVDASGSHDLLILGTHARQGLQRLFLGSVAEHVVRMSRCPVLVLPYASTPVLPVGDLTVFCPVDIEEVDLRAADWVRDHLGPDLRFELGHVLRYAPWLFREESDEVPVDAHPDAYLARGRLNDLAAVHALPASRSTVCLATRDNPGPRLAQLAHDCGAELIALPTHGRTGPARMLLGSVAERLVREAGCPVLVLR